MIDKSYAAMQYALFIKDVKDKFFCLLVRKEKTHTDDHDMIFEEQTTADMYV